MTDETDILLKMYESQWTQARQSEDQRAALTNIILLVSSAILGFISQGGLTRTTLPLTILLIVIGLYGLVASEKLHERFEYHIIRTHYWRKRIDELNPKAQFLKLQKEADEAHRKEYKVLHKLPLHFIWAFLHLAIALSGVVLTLVIVL